MSLCKVLLLSPSEGLNLTLIVKVLQIKGMIDIEGNRLKGQFGNLMDSQLENVDHSKRDCKLVGAFEFGHKLPNGSYTGVLKYLKEKTGDIYLAPSPQFFYTDFIDQSTALLTDKYAESCPDLREDLLNSPFSLSSNRLMTAHRIENGRKSKQFDAVELIWDLDFNTKIFLLLFSMVFLFLLVALAYLSIGKLIVRKLLDNFFQFRRDFRQPITTISLVLIFYHLFFMIFKLLISSQISTSKVIVDTSWIVNSMDRLLTSDLMICWIKNDVEIRMAEQSPKQSDLYRLYTKKIYATPVEDMEGEPSRHCLLSLKVLGQSFDLKDKVLFINEASLYGFLSNFVAPNPSIAYWVGETPLLETVSVYYIRRHLTRHQKLSIDTHNYWWTQSGMSARSYDQVLWSTKKMITESSKIYNNLNAYIEDNSIFTNLRLSFLGSYIWIMLAINAVSVLAFSLNLLLRYRARPKKLICRFAPQRKK